MSNYEDQNQVAPGSYMREHSLAHSRDSLFVHKRVVVGRRPESIGVVVAAHDYYCGRVYVVELADELLHVAVPDYEEVKNFFVMVPVNDP